MRVYGIQIGKDELLSVIESIGIPQKIDVEHNVSLLDDQLKSAEEKIKYAIRKISENEPSEVKLIVFNDESTLLIKIEDVIEIRMTDETEKLKSLLDKYITE